MTKRHWAFVAIVAGLSCLPGSAPALPAPVTLSLRTGWNPVAFEASRLTSLNASSAVAGLASYSSSGYSVGPVTTAQVNQGDGGRRGFWVYATSNTTLTYDGTDDGRGNFLNLESGWNLCSLAGQTPVSQSALTPSTTLLVYEVQPDGSTRPVETLLPGRAYWVFSPSAVRVSWSTVSSLSVAPANATVTRYSSVQLAATANGSTNVTSQVQWTSSEPSALGVGPTGLVTGLFPGTYTVTASLEGKSAQANVTVTDASVPGPLPTPEGRGRLYVTNNNANYVDIFNRVSLDVVDGPSARIQGASTQLNQPNFLAVDATRNILYVPGQGQVNIYENASEIVGVPVDRAPSKTIPGFGAGVGIQCVLDPVADRLYVSVSNGRLYQWDDISTNPAPTEANRSRLLTGVGANPTIALDPSNNRLFTSNTNDLTLFVYDNASSLDGSASAATRRLLTGAFGTTTTHAMTYDPGRRILYAGEPGQARLSVFSDPGAAPDGPYGPVRLVTGLASPLGLCVNPATDELYVGERTGGRVIVLANASAQSGSAVVVRSIPVTDPIGVDLDFTR